MLPDDDCPFDIPDDEQRPEICLVPSVFPFGQIVATPAALAALAHAEQTAMEFLIRHGAADWGDLCDEDKQTNDDALKHGERLLSAYMLVDSTKLWIITEHDRSVTTVLLPSDY